MINYPHAYYLKYFLTKQINCFIWNYKGYGRTSGKPDPREFSTDAEQILNYLRLVIGVRGKIGVYGRSLGCIPAAHISKHVDMIIADRGFCDLWTLADKKFYSDVSIPLIKYGTGGWQAQNAFNILKTPNKKDGCYKVVMCDKSDEIIDLHCSLMVGVASEFCRIQYLENKLHSTTKLHILSDKECQELILSMNYLLNIDYDLSDLMSVFKS